MKRPCAGIRGLRYFCFFKGAVAFYVYRVVGRYVILFWGTVRPFDFEKRVLVIKNGRYDLGADAENVASAVCDLDAVDL